MPKPLKSVPLLYKALNRRGKKHISNLPLCSEHPDVRLSGTSLRTVSQSIPGEKSLSPLVSSENLRSALMAVLSDLFSPSFFFILLCSLLAFSFIVIICPLQITLLSFHVSSLRQGVSRHSKCLPLCRLRITLVFEQVAINNASELNFNEDEAPAIRACRWLLHTKEEGSLKDRGGVSLHFYLDVLFFFNLFCLRANSVYFQFRPTHSMKRARQSSIRGRFLFDRTSSSSLILVQRWRLKRFPRQLRTLHT